MSASSSALAFTGPGTGLRVLAAGGAVLLFMGLLLLVATDSPKQLLLAVARGRLRRH